MDADRIERQKRGIRWSIKYWLRKRYANGKALEKIKEEFPHRRTSMQQVKNERSFLRAAGAKIPSSVEARREGEAKAKALQGKQSRPTRKR